MDLRAPFATPILRVLFDLARDRAATDVDEVVRLVLDRLPARGDREDLAPLVRIALRLLERSDLVQFVDHDRVRLTMTGFTLAVASPRVTPQVAKSHRKSKAAPAEPMPTPAAVSGMLPVEGAAVSVGPANRDGSVVAA